MHGIRGEEEDEGKEKEGERGTLRLAMFCS
jgi:hypothetical protein